MGREGLRALEVELVDGVLDCFFCEATLDYSPVWVALPTLCSASGGDARCGAWLGNGAPVAPS
jgi:hypothetical protein